MIKCGSIYVRTSLIRLIEPTSARVNIHIDNGDIVHVDFDSANEAKEFAASVAEACQPYKRRRGK